MPRRYTSSFGNTCEKLLDAMALVKARYKPGVTSRGEIARLLQERFDYSRAKSYRYAAVLIDKLDLDVVDHSREPIPATSPWAGLMTRFMGRTE